MRFEETYEEFGELLKKQRVSMSLTQADFAKKVGLSRASIANIENGRQKILLHQAYLFAKCLNIPLLDLLPTTDFVFQPDDIMPPTANKKRA